MKQNCRIGTKASDTTKLQKDKYSQVAKPRDKANVERSVRIIYQRIYAKLRDRQITGIEELNKNMGGVRRTKYQKNQSRNHLEKEIYERYEQTHMLPLDVTQLMEIKKQNDAKWVKKLSCRTH